VRNNLVVDRNRSQVDVVGAGWRRVVKGWSTREQNLGPLPFTSSPAIAGESQLPQGSAFSAMSEANPIVMFEASAS
jgi:hypothetical protein